MTTEATQRDHATSKATRLLSAGTYLDPVYRKSVIKELLADRFRVVAPSYGYDAVTVLAHALAAHRIRRNQLWLLAAGAAGIVALMAAGAFGRYSALLLFGWLGWATSYLRRIATIHTLMTRLKGSGPDGGFDGAYPITDELTEELVRKIDHEQTSGDGVVYYGGYKPFVGAGKLIHQWASAELLIGARSAWWSGPAPCRPRGRQRYADGTGRRARSGPRRGAERHVPSPGDGGTQGGRAVLGRRHHCLRRRAHVRATAGRGTGG